MKKWQIIGITVTSLLIAACASSTPFQLAKQRAQLTPLGTSRQAIEQKFTPVSIIEDYREVTGEANVNYWIDKNTYVEYRVDSQNNLVTPIHVVDTRMPKSRHEMKQPKTKSLTR